MDRKRSHILDGFTYLEQKVLVLGTIGTFAGISLLHLVSLVG